MPCPPPSIICCRITPLDYILPLAPALTIFPVRSYYQEPILKEDITILSTYYSNSLLSFQQISSKVLTIHMVSTSTPEQTLVRFPSLYWIEAAHIKVIRDFRITNSMVKFLVLILLKLEAVFNIADVILKIFSSPGSQNTTFTPPPASLTALFVSFALLTFSIFVDPTGIKSSFL